MTSLLEVQNAGWRAGSVSILEGVTFAVRSGELIALMGRNGSGKSTLLDLIAGLRRLTDGTIFLDGRPLDEWPRPAVARVVSHLPQVMRDNVACSAEQLVLMGRYPHAERWWESDMDREVVAQAMSRCDCRQFQHRPVSTLSGGERQRVFLAACLAQAPRLLLLDEPATFLDIDQQLQCFSLLREEAEEVVERALAAAPWLEPSRFPGAPARDLAGEATMFRVTPRAHGTDGYFLASLRRKT